MGSKLVVSVSQSAVVQAESSIFGCVRCASGATLPFWRVLDRARSYVEEDIAYILPALATCPKCRGPIDENTLVAPKPRRKSLSLALLFRRLVGKAIPRSPVPPNPVYHEKSKSGPDSSPERPQEDTISQ
jgi:hypothetical protein